VCSGSLFSDWAIEDAIQALRQTYQFRSGDENIPLVLINMHCHVKSQSVSHVAALLGKS
jgi:hypothetical protein